MGISPEIEHNSHIKTNQSGVVIAKTTIVKSLSCNHKQSPMTKLLLASITILLSISSIAQERINGIYPNMSFRAFHLVTGFNESDLSSSKDYQYESNVHGIFGYWKYGFDHRCSCLEKVVFVSTLNTRRTKGKSYEDYKSAMSGAFRELNKKYEKSTEIFDISNAHDTTAAKYDTKLFSAKWFYKGAIVELSLEYHGQMRPEFKDRNQTNAPPNGPTGYVMRISYTLEDGISRVDFENQSFALGSDRREFAKTYLRFFKNGYQPIGSISEEATIAGVRGEWKYEFYENGMIEGGFLASSEQEKKWSKSDLSLYTKATQELIDQYTKAYGESTLETNNLDNFNLKDKDLTRETPLMRYQWTGIDSERGLTTKYVALYAMQWTNYKGGDTSIQRYFRIVTGVAMPQ